MLFTLAFLVASGALAQSPTRIVERQTYCLQANNVSCFIAGSGLIVTPPAVPGNPPTISVAPSPSGGSTFAWGVVPSGLVNGTNAVFTLPAAPASGAAIFVNGIRQNLCPPANLIGALTVCDYSISGGTITFAAKSVPVCNAVTGVCDTLVVDYQ